MDQLCVTRPLGDSRQLFPLAPRSSWKGLASERWTFEQIGVGWKEVGSGLGGGREWVVGSGERGRECFDAVSLGGLELREFRVWV